MEDLILKGVCYVLVRTNAVHPIAFNRHDLLWYPETGMSLLNRINYNPFVQSIVTECPWLVGCYDASNVRIWDVSIDEWRIPNCQTYGCSSDCVLSSIMGIRQTMPSTPLDGGVAIEKLTKKLEESYNRA